MEIMKGKRLGNIIFIFTPFSEYYLLLYINECSSFKKFCSTIKDAEIVADLVELLHEPRRA